MLNETIAQRTGLPAWGRFKGIHAPLKWKHPCFHKPQSDKPILCTLSHCIYPHLSERAKEQIKIKNRRKTQNISTRSFALALDLDLSPIEREWRQSDLECGLMFQGIVKTRMFSHSGPRMALKRPLKHKPALRSTYYQAPFPNVPFGCKEDCKCVLLKALNSIYRLHFLAF